LLPRVDNGAAGRIGKGEHRLGQWAMGEVI